MVLLQSIFNQPLTTRSIIIILGWRKTSVVFPLFPNETTPTWRDLYGRFPYIRLDTWLGKVGKRGHSIPIAIHVWYIYLHEWLIFMVNVGKYTSPMDAMGMIGHVTYERRTQASTGTLKKKMMLLSKINMVMTQNVFVLCGHGGECLHLRKFQQTPETYPRPSTTYLWRKSFHICILGYLDVPGVQGSVGIVLD